MPPLKTAATESPSPFTPLGTKGMGEGGGAGIHAVCAAVQDALRGHGGAIVSDSCNPYHRVWELLEAGRGRRPRQRGGYRRRLDGADMNVSGERIFAAPRTVVWQVLNDPASMAKTMPGVESFDVHDAQRWTANVKIPLGLGGLKMKIDMDKTEEREPEYAQLNIKGKGVGAMLSMITSFELGDVDGGTAMKWAADVKVAGPVGSMGQRVLQPIVNQQVEHVLSALDRQVQDAVAGGAS